MATPLRRVVIVFLLGTGAVAPALAFIRLSFAHAPPAAAPAPVPEWKQTFERAYRLEDDQVLKRMAPPHLPERLT